MEVIVQKSFVHRRKLRLPSADPNKPTIVDLDSTAYARFSKLGCVVSLEEHKILRDADREAEKIRAAAEKAAGDARRKAIASASAQAQSESSKGDTKPKSAR